MSITSECDGGRKSIKIYSGFDILSRLVESFEQLEIVQKNIAADFVNRFRVVLKMFEDYASDIEKLQNRIKLLNSRLNRKYD